MIINPPIWQAGRLVKAYNQKNDEKLFSSHPIKSLIKESAQNSLDALNTINKEEVVKKFNLFNFDKKNKVKIRYEIIELSGEAKESWKNAIDYENSYNKLQNVLLNYLKNSKNEGGKLLYKNEYQQLLSTIKKMESNEPIVILNITDTNTTGLTGLDEPNLSDKDKKHHKLHKTNAENISVDGGGSWGLGKNSYSNLSSLGMFITSTNISNPKKAGAPFDNSINRIYGTALNISAHNDEWVEGKNLDSSWNFGILSDQAFNPSNSQDASDEFPKTNRTISFWDNTELAAKLYIDCLESQQGTTVQIPMIKESLGEGDLVESLANKIKDTCNLWLWPALISNRLEVEIFTVKISSGSRADNLKKFNQIAVEPSDDPIVSPYIDLFEKINLQQAFEKQYKDDGEYFLIDNIESKLPKVSDAYSTKGSLSYSPNVYLKIHENTHELEDKDLKNYRNSLAMIRSVGIVIRYERERITGIPNDLCFTGLALLGTSEENKEVNKIAESVVRLSENASHNKIANEPQDNKLETYFELKDEKPHTWGTQRINSNILDPIYNSLKTFLFSNRKSNKKRNDYLEGLDTIGKPPKSKEKTYIKFNKRISPKLIQFIITAGKGKKITLSLHDFTVSERGESGGDLSISKITKENKSWKPYYSQNGKISIEKSPNENIFTMLNRDKTDKSIKIEIELDLTANTGIQLSNPSLNLNYTQKIEDYK